MNPRIPSLDQLRAPLLHRGPARRWTWTPQQLQLEYGDGTTIVVDGFALRHHVARLGPDGVGRVLDLAGQILDLVAEPNPHRQLGEMVRQRRRQLGLSTTQLAGAMRRPSAQIQQLERGEVLAISWDVLEDVLRWPHHSCERMLNERSPEPAIHTTDREPQLWWCVPAGEQPGLSWEADLERSPGIRSVRVTLRHNELGWVLVVRGGASAQVLEHQTVTNLEVGMRLAQELARAMLTAQDDPGVVLAGWALDELPAAVRWQIARNAFIPPRILAVMVRSSRSSAAVLSALAANPSTPAADRTWLATMGVRPMR